jgi:hypothetical protein
MKVYLADTEQVRDVARQAFVKVTGSCYYYKSSWTDKDKSSYGKYFRRLAFLARPDKAEQIVEVMHEMAEKRGLALMTLRATPSGYIRCKAIFQPDVDKVFQNQ